MFPETFHAVPVADDAVGHGGVEEKGAAVVVEFLADERGGGAFEGASGNDALVLCAPDFGGQDDLMIGEGEYRVAGSVSTSVTTQEGQHM